MLNFKGTTTLLGVKESEWTNPESGQTVKFHDIVTYVNTGFKSGPQAYVYHLKLNSKTKHLLDTVKTWGKGTQVSIAGLVTSVDKPSKSDPTRMWTNMGLLVSEISPAMESQPAAVAEKELPVIQQEPVQFDAIEAQPSGLDDIPFSPILD